MVRPLGVPAPLSGITQHGPDSPPATPRTWSSGPEGTVTLTSPAATMPVRVATTSRQMMVRWKYHVARAAFECHAAGQSGGRRSHRTRARPAGRRAGAARHDIQEDSPMRFDTHPGATRFIAIAGLLALALACSAPTALAQSGPCCVMPDNGTGTADHVPNCPSGYQGQMQIINGFPIGTTLDISAVLGTFAGLVQSPGGTLGGNIETWTGVLNFQMTGTGGYLGYIRNLNIPVSTGQSHSAPRMLFAPSQSFDTDLFELQGQVVGDPDFDLLRVTAGTNYGLPSPGHTIFSQTVGGWAVDSFFDITYRIDFVGSPGGPFAGRSGSTTGTYRFVMCHDAPTGVRHSTWGAVKQFYR
jgi:hypothetical protein